MTTDKQRLVPGDPAPAFSLPDSFGQEVALADYPGQRVIVYFYPKALTPGCTTQAVDFTAALTEFSQAGLQILGISPDPVSDLAKFRETEQVGFPLLSNPDLSVLNAYGAYGEKTMYGKTITTVLRSTFVISVAATGGGTVEVAQYNVKATGHVSKLGRDLGLALQ